MISNYQQLCPVVFGAGACAQLPEKVKQLGGKKALCIYDNGVQQSGIADKILTILKEGNVETVIFSDVLPDAPASMINQAGKLAQDEKVDIVIGVGGGSTLDTAKAVAVLLENPLPIEQYFVSRGTSFVSTKPLILMPTTSGTGSEVTIMSVVHDEQTHTKDSILRAATLAIVDPELTITVPAHVTAMTGFDALSHAIESYTTISDNPKANLLAVAAIELIAKSLVPAVENGNDIDARTDLAFASNIAGMAFNDALLHFGHAAAHELGVVFHIPHGVACALTIPEMIVFASDVLPQKTKNIAAALGMDVPEDATGEQIGELAADFIRQLMKRLNIKSLKDFGVSRESAMACAPGAIAHNPFIAFAPKPIDEELLGVLIGKMYDNYQ